MDRGVAAPSLPSATRCTLERRADFARAGDGGMVPCFWSRGHGGRTVRDERPRSTCGLITGLLLSYWHRGVHRRRGCGRGPRKLRGRTARAATTIRGFDWVVPQVEPAVLAKGVFPRLAGVIALQVALSALAWVAIEADGQFGLSATFVDPQGHQIVGVLVSFMVCFRCQTASARYWEARGSLGALLAGLVDLASRASVSLGNVNSAEGRLARKEIGMLIKQYFACTAQTLRAASFETVRRDQYWEAGRLSDIVCEPPPERPPLALRRLRAALFQHGVKDGLFPGASDGERMQTFGLYEKQLAGLQGSQNALLKIATTTSPLPYTQLTRWLLFFFVFTLPFVLTFKLGIFATLVATVSAVAFYGLECISLELWQPFVANQKDSDGDYWLETELDGRFQKVLEADVEALLGIS